MAGVDLALDVARDVADAVDVGDRRSAEFHHKPGHGGDASPQHTYRRRDLLERRPKRRVYIPAGSGGCNRDARLTIESSQWPNGRRPSGPTTVDPAEVERFSALAAEWWDPRGKMAPLHKFNPVRLGYIRDQAACAFGRDPSGSTA